MTDSTQNLLGSLVTRLNDLEARLARVVDDACSCASCMGARTRARDSERRTRHAEVLALVGGERTAAVAAMASVDRARMLADMAPTDAIDLVLSLPEGVRAEVRDRDLPVGLRDRCELADLEIPDLYRVQARPGIILGVGYRNNVTPSQAGRLFANGLGRCMHPLDGPKNGAHVQWAYVRALQISHGAYEVLSESEIELVREVDVDLADLMDRGQVTMQSLTDAEARDHVLDCWRRGERRPLTARRRAAEVTA